MKYTFKRKSKKCAEDVKCKERYLFQRFDEANLWLQHKCVVWLERKTAHLSAKSWILILFSFVVFTVGGNVYLIVDSLNGNDSKSIERSPISRPTNTVVFDPKQNQLNRSLSKTELERIVRSQIYTDSLGRSPTRKRVQDSILKFRPGL
jgi:hypothetical protein